MSDAAIVNFDWIELKDDGRGAVEFKLADGNRCIREITADAANDHIAFELEASLAFADYETWTLFQETITSRFPARFRTAFRADELMETEFAEPVQIVPGIVPEGIGVLTGAPKIGKSWLVDGVGIATASGGKALGSIDTLEGDVLLLALEDSPRRMKTRLGKLLAEAPAPKRLHIRNTWRRLDQGGLDDLRAWCESVDAPRLIIVDTLAKVRSPRGRGEDVYASDYAALSAFQGLTMRLPGLAVLLVHHTRKAVSDDWVETVSGSHGVTGSVDTVLVLRRMRGQGDAELLVTGRDVAEAELALRWDPMWRPGCCSATRRSTAYRRSVPR